MVDAKVDTLLTVAEQKNFTKAAQLLSLTQPAVSHQINQLEQELQVSLFIRKKGDLLLTPEGRSPLNLPSVSRRWTISCIGKLPTPSGISASFGSASRIPRRAIL